MANDPDRYEAWYAEKLWNLLPAIYRAEDSDDFNRKGPLRELVERVGAQAAVVRRSIDRLWEDQSIETCDDWVIAYLGELLQTNLVASLDARGRRVDVARTIYYRRRKGTIGLLEELASDITGWSARAVEFFHRLGRTRHGLDPAIGFPVLPTFSAVAHAGASSGTLRLGGSPLNNHSISVSIDVAGQVAVASWSTSIDGAGWVSQGTASSATLDPPGGGTIVVMLVNGGGTPSFVLNDTFTFVVTADPRLRLQLAQGLIGARTLTGAGGLADLRNVHGAALTNTPFDEFFHTADVRRGRGMTGWHDIPRLGVFLWRLKSLPVAQVTPVRDKTCPNQYTFDPTGRDIPLFAAGARPFGDQWVSPQPHQLPGPITADLIKVALLDLYRDPRPDAPASSLAVYRKLGSLYDLIPAVEISSDPRQRAGRPWIDAERGRIVWPAAPTDGPFRVSYHHGFSSEIGAGAYDRLAPGASEEEPPLPVTLVNEGVPLAPALLHLDPSSSALSGTVVIGDSVTYPTVADLDLIDHVELRAENKQRPVIRPDAARWVFTGRGDATLALRGLFISGGCDLVLQGSFDRVTLSCCTLDPGSWNPAPPRPGWRLAADGRKLAATRLSIRGRVRLLEIERCITGPILTERAPDGSRGLVESVAVRDSIVQGADYEALAISLSTGQVALSRCTVLGWAQVHRLDASECILHDFVGVDDCQHGCVRFSAYSTGSVLPRQYESVPERPRAGLFASREFGRPEYAQLLATASSAIAGGAEDGSEMGAFSREKSAVKERSLLIKYQEYLPLGLEPVVIHVT